MLEFILEETVKETETHNNENAQHAYEDSMQQLKDEEDHFGETGGGACDGNNQRKGSY